MSYTIGVIGTGYVGLVTGTCLAEVGNTVICVDVDPAKVEVLSTGTPTIYERGLDQLLERNVREERIRFTLDLEEAVTQCSIIMLCLPTPPGKDGSADLAAVMKVAEEIARIAVQKGISEPRIIVNKSTVPVGTSQRVKDVLQQHAPKHEMYVVSNPEFLREGFAVEDFMKPGRVIVGTSDPYAREIMTDLYQPFVRGGSPIYVFDERSAEVTKYAANAFLAVKISFMNDMSEYCERVGADIENVRLGIGSDDRIGRRFLFAGLGYGGSCFPKDVKAIIHSAREMDTPLEIVEATQAVNKHQAERFIDRIRQRFDGKLEGRDVALWGLAFKPNTDDVRDAPAFAVINALLADGARVHAYDPEAKENAERVYGDRIRYADTMYDAVVNADVLVIATEWNEFRNPNFARVRNAMVRPLIFDGRNLYTLDEMSAERFEYHSVGRASIAPLT